MIPKKIKMSVMTSNGNGTFSFNGESKMIDYPFQFYVANNNYSIDSQTGRGTYFGTSQMFGGPTSGDIVIFDKSSKPFYTMITSWTQDWDVRRCGLQFLFFKKDYWKLVKKSFTEMYHNGEITPEEFNQEMVRVFGVDKATKICSEEAEKYVEKNKN